MQPMATKPTQAPSNDNPKQTFEIALALMQNTAGCLPLDVTSRRRPIAVVPGAQPIEKRALSDAARALARLWNVPHLVR